MAYRSLRDFIAFLESQGELVRIKAPVSVHLQLTELCTRLVAEGGPAVLIENPIDGAGAPAAMPVLANLFGTVGRVARGITLGGQPRTTAIELRAVGEVLAALRQPTPPKDLRDALGMLPLAKTAMDMRPKVVS